VRDDEEDSSHGVSRQRTRKAATEHPSYRIVDLTSSVSAAVGEKGPRGRSRAELPRRS
jgi:hypothetical protein